MLRSSDPYAVNHPDRGCKLFPVCLECPLPRCCMDQKPPGDTDARKLQRAADVDRLGKEGMTVRAISEVLSISPRTVRRVRALLRP